MGREIPLTSAVCRGRLLSSFRYPWAFPENCANFIKTQFASMKIPQMFLLSTSLDFHLETLIYEKCIDSVGLCRPRTLKHFSSVIEIHPSSLRIPWMFFRRRNLKIDLEILHRARSIFKADALWWQEVMLWLWRGWGTNAVSERFSFCKKNTGRDLLPFHNRCETLIWLGFI